MANTNPSIGSFIAASLKSIAAVGIKPQKREASETKGDESKVEHEDQSSHFDGQNLIQAA
jgi:hypothetical protein